MEIEGHYYLGKLLKIIGLQGSLLIDLDVDDPTPYHNLPLMYVLVGGNLVPFMIEEIKLRPGKKAEIRLQDISDPEQAEILIGCPIYLPLSALPTLGENQFYYHEIVGFNIIDEEFGEVGKVEQVLDYPMQALFQVFHQSKEVLIPIADDILKQVDKKNRVIHIRAPEGLINMYLE